MTPRESFAAGFDSDADIARGDSINGSARNCLTRSTVTIAADPSACSYLLGRKQKRIPKARIFQDTSDLRQREFNRSLLCPETNHGEGLFLFLFLESSLPCKIASEYRSAQREGGWQGGGRERHRGKEGLRILILPGTVVASGRDYERVETHEK